MSKYYLVACKKEIDYVLDNFSYHNKPMSSPSMTHTLAEYADYLYIDLDKMIYMFREELSFHQMISYKLIDLENLNFLMRGNKIDKILGDEG